MVRAKMRVVRVTVGPLLAAMLLVFCIGLQLLEATGRWDTTFQDAGDEAVIVAVVLCIGAALIVARATRHITSLFAIRLPFLVVRAMPRLLFVPPAGLLTLSVGPPLSLRI